ncbi:hypothetical protein SLA2020_288280 [Shorea laevis]
MLFSLKYSLPAVTINPSLFSIQIHPVDAAPNTQNSDHRLLSVCYVLRHNLHLSKKRRRRNTAVSGDCGWELEMEALERLERPV